MNIRRISMGAGVSVLSVLGLAYFVTGAYQSDSSANDRNAARRVVENDALQGADGSAMSGDNGNAMQGSADSAMSGDDGNAMQGTADSELNGTHDNRRTRDESGDFAAIALQGSLSDFNGDQLIRLTDSHWLIDRPTHLSVVLVSDDDRTLTAYHTDDAEPSVARMRQGSANGLLELVSKAAITTLQP